MSTGTQGLAPVVHGLEDRVGVVVVVGRDLDQSHLGHQPVDEVRQRVAELPRPSLWLDVPVSRVHRLDRLVLAVRVEGFALEQRLDHRQSLRNVKVERGFAQIVGVDRGARLARPASSLLLRGTVEVDEQQRQGRNTLLAVDQVVLAIALADDDGAEEVVLVAGDLLGVVAVW